MLPSKFAHQERMTTRPGVGRYKASKYDIWALGITIVIGGQYFSWNAGLAAGVWSTLVSIVVTGTSYVCLVLCLAETVSGLPFSGGAFGLSRCSLGFYGGYVVGCCECLQYIVYTASSVLVLGNMILELMDPLPHLVWFARPLAWLSIYGVALGLQNWGQRCFWQCNVVLAFLSLGILLVYILGSLPHVSYEKYGGGPTHYFKGGMQAFMENFPLSAWFFVGIEALNAVANMVDAPKTIIPSGQTACVITLAATAVGVYFVAICMPPGVDTTEVDLVVIRGGIMASFGAGPYVATALSLPATFATIYGFIFLYSTVLASMAASKLMPTRLGYQHPVHKTHPVAAVAGSAVSFVLCIVGQYWTTLHLFNICMVFGFSANMAQLWNYVYMRRNFNHLTRSFQSPVGLAGAAFSMVVSGLQLVALLVFQPFDGITPSVVAVTLLVLTCVYVYSVRDSQTISRDEHRVLFFAHISKSNYTKREITKRRTSLETSAKRNSAPADSKESTTTRGPPSIMSMQTSDSLLINFTRRDLMHSWKKIAPTPDSPLQYGQPSSPTTDDVVDAVPSTSPTKHS
ncbi:hypothetical protein B5M09_009332 [Aphanomyces astaci]|uniref:Amino acid permease/ SLC12A domain-containing protein n=2 Tax=Aphanomyces astaci TaxID=112090 RepID=A0A3R7XP15_APHAT|nr:hypothetical protein B5M09_009332 [Aphanomyces astaci]